MKFSSLFAAIAIAAGASIAFAESPSKLGTQDITFPAPGSGERLSATVWYPAADGGTATMTGESSVFEGSLAYNGAPPKNGVFPLIVMSHGGLRSAPGLGNWIASDLAGRGYMVAVLSPREPRARKAKDAVQDVWMRSAELSALLSGVESDPVMAAHFERARVGALGFFLGATSALQMAGARMDPELFADSCDDGADGNDCAWFRASELDLHAINLEAMGQSRRDPRIQAVVAVNPEFGAEFVPESLSGISVPIQLIDLGAGKASHTRSAAEALEKNIPGSRHIILPNATPFDAFSVCKPAGHDILSDGGDGENPCDPGRMPREEVHAILAAKIDDAFRQVLFSPQ